MSWSSRITDELRSLKDRGLEFDAAWRVAVERHPPPQMALGPAEPTFEDAGEESLFEFVERTARAQWHGEGTRIDRSLLEDAHAGVFVHGDPSPRSTQIGRARSTA